VGAVVVGEREMASADGHPGVAHWFEGRLGWTARADRAGSQQLAVQRRPEAGGTQRAAAESLQEAARGRARESEKQKRRARREKRRVRAAGGEPAILKVPISTESAQRYTRS
jgi:hypothetical protein